MSELVWGIKNGDIDQVKDIVENNVSAPGDFIVVVFANDSWKLWDKLLRTFDFKTDCNV